jgi:hypothetical protein
MLATKAFPALINGQPVNEFKHYTWKLERVCGNNPVPVFIDLPKLLFTAAGIIASSTTSASGRMAR